MGRVAAAALVAAVVCGTATAAAPAGFWTNGKLAPAASWVAGKQVTVYCASTVDALKSTVVGEAIPDLQGTAIAGDSVINLSPLTCSYLDAWMNGKKVKNLYGVAGSMLTLAHEAEHAKGMSDETDTDCAALHALPRMVAKFMPLRQRETLHDLMFDAWRGHSTKSAAYQTHAC